MTRLVSLALIAALSATALSQNGPWTLDLETGLYQVNRNDVRIPGEGGTRFNFRQLTGSDPSLHLRSTVTFQTPQGPEYRLLIAPLRLNREGRLRQTTTFAGETFSAGPASGVYQFNSYRLTYRNRFQKGPRSDWRVGFTAKVRDAEVSVRQGSTRATKTDVGFVPLLHLCGEERLSPRWTFALDLDGAAAPQGRAFDVGARFFYRVDDRSSLTFGYRVLEGGVDNDEVYNFPLIQYAVVGWVLRF